MNILNLYFNHVFLHEALNFLMLSLTNTSYPFSNQCCPSPLGCPRCGTVWLLSCGLPGAVPVAAWASRAAPARAHFHLWEPQSRRMCFTVQGIQGCCFGIGCLCLEWTPQDTSRVANSLPVSTTHHGKFWALKQPVLLSSKLESCWI